MTRRRIVILGAVMIAVTAVAATVIVTARHDTNERRAKFFGSSNEYPTTGGEKMKVDW